MVVKLSRRKVLNGISTCSTMVNHWRNGSVPSCSYSDSVKEIKEVLESLLVGTEKIEWENEG